MDHDASKYPPDAFWRNCIVQYCTYGRTFDHICGFRSWHRHTLEKHLEQMGDKPLRYTLRFSGLDFIPQCETRDPSSIFLEKGNHHKNMIYHHGSPTICGQPGVL